MAGCGLCAPHQKADHRRVGAACRVARRRISPTGHFALDGRAGGPEGPAFFANGQNSYSGRFNWRMLSVLSRSERRLGARLSGAPCTVGDPTTAEHAAARPVCLCIASARSDRPLCRISRISSGMMCPCRRWMLPRQGPGPAAHVPQADQSGRRWMEERRRPPRQGAWRLPGIGIGVAGMTESPDTAAPCGLIQLGEVT